MHEGEERSAAKHARYCLLSRNQLFYRRHVSPFYGREVDYVSPKAQWVNGLSRKFTWGPLTTENIRPRVTKRVYSKTATFHQPLALVQIKRREMGLFKGWAIREVVYYATRISTRYIVKRVEDEDCSCINDEWAFRVGRLGEGSCGLQEQMSRAATARLPFCQFAINFRERTEGSSLRNRIGQRPDGVYDSKTWFLRTENLCREKAS